jgi:hypothetical protein
MDYGTTWNLSDSGLPVNLGVSDLVVDPKTPSTVYAAVGASATLDGGIYKSTNGGASWSDATNGIRNFDWTSFYSSFYSNIHFSGSLPNCGTTRTTISAMHLAIDPTNPATLFSIVNGIVFRTTDAAANWSVADSGLLFIVNEIVVSPADSTAVYAASQGVYVYKASGGGGGTTSITVNSPNGGESWLTGSTQNITWTSTGTVGNVKIEVSTDGGTNYTTIVASTANTGSYSWTVPNTASGTAKIRISDAAGTVSDTSNGNFTITATCTYSLNSTSVSFGASGGVGNLNVVAAGGSCAWTATSNNSWISITSGTSGSGNGTVD